MCTRHDKEGVFYLLFISRQVQEFKNYQNPSSTSKVTYKTIFNNMFNLFSICNTFEFKATRFLSEQMTQYTCESRVNVNHAGM